jgi:hypothetical protein
MSNVIDILGKSSCVDNQDNCNIVRPFSKLELYNINPATNEKYTIGERNDKILQHKNICELNKNKVSKCCDKDDLRLTKMAQTLPKEFKDKYSKIKVEKTRNNKSVIKVCPGNNCVGYRRPTAYELCKLSSAVVDTETRVASNLVPECLTGSCNSELMPFVINNNDKHRNYSEDRNLIEYIKEDNIDSLKAFLHGNKKDSNKILSYGFPGNTLLHESIYRKANNCIHYILENTTQSTLEIKNKDGNTPLQIACLKNNINIVHKLLLIGANIHTTNKYTETPLHSGVRSGSNDIVRVLLLNGSSIHDKNKLGQSALHAAVLTPKKSLDMIKILTESGSDILTKDIENHNILYGLNKQIDDQLNAEINTYLTNACFNKYSAEPETYKQVLAEYPDFSPYIIEDVDSEEAIMEESDIDGIEVYYDEALSDGELYHKKHQLPRKVLPLSAKKHIEHFESNINRNSVIDNERYLLYIMLAIFIAVVIYNNRH